MPLSYILYSLRRNSVPRWNAEAGVRRRGGGQGLLPHLIPAVTAASCLSAQTGRCNRQCPSHVPMPVAFLASSLGHVRVLSHFSHAPLFATPWTAAHRLLCPWDSPGKDTGVGCHALLQGIFPTQGSNLRPLHRQMGSLVPPRKPIPAKAGFHSEKTLPFLPLLRSLLLTSWRGLKIQVSCSSPPPLSFPS